MLGVMLTCIIWKTVHADPLSLKTGPASDAFHENRTPSTTAKVLTILIGTCSTLALTFSEASRCVFVLGMLQFFTNKGRAALLAYTLILALSSPAKNTATNMEILTESLACGQELLKSSVIDLFSFTKEPFTVFKKAVGHVFDAIEGVFGRMREELETVVESVKDIVSTIRAEYSKLKEAVDMCNAELGTPYERCLVSFETASKDCADKLGSSFDWMCKSVSIFDSFCAFAKISDVFCWFPSLVKEHLFDPILSLNHNKYVKTYADFRAFSDGFHKFFDARLNITYKLDHGITKDKTLSQVFEGISQEIVGRCSWIFEYISLFDLTLLIPLLIIVFKAFSYRWKFLKSDRYDNYYLSDSLIRMDIRRFNVGGESIFPLRYRESNLYVETFTWRMVKEERKQRKLAIVLVCLASIQILTYVFMDYALYRFMEWIRLNAAVEYQKWNDPLLGLTATVEGEGFLASMYRNIIDSFNPINFVLPSLDTTKCLPFADKPDYKMYFWIVFLLLACFLLALFEPYGLRLRHLICGWIYPYRVRERERWLYVHIQTNRDSFLTFARKVIRDKLGFKRRKQFVNKRGNRKSFQVSITERLVHRIPFLANCFDPTTIKCFICGSQGHHDDRENFIDCLECKTVYCLECMKDMHDQCVICSNALDSDASTIDDSGDEREVYREENSDEEDETKSLLKKSEL
ncbi:DC-STAMP domain-containing protein 2 [Orchesella cincta]|uniref:DC-STAMP domain-containing protein 2 n=1 Tax=Orchesella cincta TaxID=48709 RepID=A0A1D2N7R4_ORCCI|nr:DC-STAMP domain-containing protein 2 [Orchesella cincta]